MRKPLRIGTRESQLAVWQATRVQELLAENNIPSELVYIKSEGDIDLQTPLYDMGVQGIFTRSLDIALLADRIDLAVHSMKDVPTQLPKGIVQAAVLERASYKDILVFKGDSSSIYEQLALTGNRGTPVQDSTNVAAPFTIATSSIRRKAQWLNRYPGHIIENLRGNVNTRLRKVAEQPWQGAIFAAAGLERIGLRPTRSIDLDWMLPAPAQGAIVAVCRESDAETLQQCKLFNHQDTALCALIERDFLRALLGGCSTPISALAQVSGDKVHFRGNILSVNGTEKVDIERTALLSEATNIGKIAAAELLSNGGQKIADGIRNELK